MVVLEREDLMKGADKQKKMAKKQPQKTLKEKRADKRAAESNKPNTAS
jgi:hypothetical protein